MATIDPNIALGVKPLQIENPMNQYAMMSQIQAGQNQNALAQYQLATAKRTEEGQNALSAAYRKAYNPEKETIDNSLLSKEIANSGFGHLLPKIQQDILARQKEEGAIKKQDTEITQKKLEIQKEQFANLAFNPSNENVKAHLQDSVLKGELPQAQADQLWAKVANLNPAQRSQYFTEMGMKAHELGTYKETVRSHKVNEGISGGHLAVAQGNLKINQDKATREQTMGTIPAGYRLAADGKSLEAMPGGPTTVVLPPKELQKRESAFPAATTAIKTVEAKADKLIADIETLRKHPGLSSITGVVGGRTPSISKEGRAAQALYDSIISRGGFTELQDMRKASPTGGALGNVSNFENQGLRDAFGALNRTQDASDLRTQLGRVAEDVRGSKTRIREAFDTTYEYRNSAGGANQQSSSSNTPVVIKSDAEYEALPSGTTFVDPQGKTRRKP